MKRLVITLVAALMCLGMLAGAAFGAAAALNVNGGVVQIGSDVTLSAEDGIQITDWGVNYDGKVTFIQVDGVNDTALTNALLGGWVTDSGGSIIGYTTMIDDGTGAAAITVGYGIPATINTSASTYSRYGFVVRNPRNGAGSYKLQLIDLTGGHGVNGASIAGITMFIEGATP
jgi:hypothetical protein